MEHIVTWAKEHMVLAIVAGLFLLFLIFKIFGGSGSSSSSSDSSGAAAYYNAQASQNEAGDAVMIAQDNDQASTAQVGIAAQASEANNTTWANADQSIDTSDNDVTTSEIASAERITATNQNFDNSILANEVNLSNEKKNTTATQELLASQYIPV